MQDGAATLEDSLVASYKTKHTLTMRSSHRAPWYLPKGAENLGPHKNLHMDVYSSFIHNAQNLETTKMSCSRWIDKYINEIVSSTKKKWAIKPWKAMEKP